MPAQYYFDELDPTSFQRLVNTLLTKKYGEGVRLLPLRGSDGGRDAETPAGSNYFEVEIADQNGERSEAIRPGRYLFQVKHHRLSDRPPSTARSAVLQDFTEELTKNVMSRILHERVDYFFLITNVPSSKDAFQRVDERRGEALTRYPDLYAEILWQDHVTSWLDQTPSIWGAFPELFAGRIVPSLGQIAANPSSGLAFSLKVAMSAQLSRDSVIRFRQINLEQRLALLFVDLDARPSDFNRYVHLGDGSLEEVDLNELTYQLSGGRRSGAGAIPLLTSEVDRNFSKIILEGGPGQGKSTVTQMLVQIYRSLIVRPDSEYSKYSSKVRRARLPIRVELRLFAEWVADSNKSVEQYLATTFSQDAGGATISVEDLQNAARQQDVLLIFDGLDEVGSDSLRDEVVKKIVECVARFETAVESNLRVIVTSRPPAVAGRLDALKGFRRLQLQPLDDKRVEEYLTRWTEVQCSDTADRERVVASFTKRKAEDHVRALVKNPMQLSVLLHFIRLKGEAFPDKRAELYREYFKTVIDRDVEKSPELRRNRDDIETLHEVIGFTIHSRAEGTNASSRLTRPDLIRLVRKWFQSEGRNPDSGEHLFAIGEERLGLIMALSGEGEATQYGFEIQPVREYFAAAFINDKFEANAHDLFGHMIVRPYWREVARFLAGLRRANERADLLSRSRDLDEDPANGWRSDGLAIILQLLQEGVLSSPGHVHRDALGFLLKNLDNVDQRVRVGPKGMVGLLPGLIGSCDSDQPRQHLQSLLEKARTWHDHYELKQLWSVCNKVLSDSELLTAIRDYQGDDQLKALMAIRWPVEAGRSLIYELAQSGQLAKLDPRLKNEQIFFVAMSDRLIRKNATVYADHNALVEEFIFQGVFGHEYIHNAGSDLAIWQLCEWLHWGGLSLVQHTMREDASDRPLITDGLDRGIASFLTDTVELLRSAALSGSASRRAKATRQLLGHLIEVGSSEDLLGMLAIRCASTLLGYVEGPRRVLLVDGKMAWAHQRSISVGSRSEAWKKFRKALVPFYAAALPRATDSAGRTLASQLAGQGFHRSLHSHVKRNGEWVSLLHLLEEYRNGFGGPDWLDRMPIQHYWLRENFDRKNTKAKLDVIGRSRMSWGSRVLSLTQAQVGWIAEMVRTEGVKDAGTEVLFALQGSNLSGRFRKGTLEKVLTTAYRGGAHGTYVFDRDEYNRQGVPEVIADAARAILVGELKTTSAIASAAATFMSEESGVLLPPLRNLEFLPSSARSWYEA